MQVPIVERCRRPVKRESLGAIDRILRPRRRILVVDFDLGLLWGLLSQGGKVLVWGGGGAFLGLLVGLAFVAAAYWWLLHGRAERLTTTGLLVRWTLWLVWLIVVPLGLAAAGSSFGMAEVSGDLIRKGIWLDGVVDAALDGVAYGLRESGVGQDEPTEAVVAFVEGERSFPIDQVEVRLDEVVEVWRSRSEEVEQVVDDWLENNIEDAEADRWARALAVRLLDRLKTVRVEHGAEFMGPVLTQLESRGATEVTGPQVMSAVVRAHLLEPLARGVELPLRIQAWGALGVVAGFVLLPLPLLLIGRGSAPAESEAAGSP